MKMAWFTMPEQLKVSMKEAQNPVQSKIKTRWQNKEKEIKAVSERRRCTSFSNFKGVYYKTTHLHRKMPVFTA